jgi:hypothetical protein
VKNKYILDKKSLNKNPKNRCANASPTELLNICKAFAIYLWSGANVFKHASPLLQYHVCIPIIFPKKCLKNPTTNNNTYKFLINNEKNKYKITS